MSLDKDIAALRRSLFAGGDQSISFYARVKSVDPDKRVCVVTDHNGIDYDDVLLYAIENIDLKGFVFIPKVDSNVIVSRIGASNELFISLFSEVDKVLLTIGDNVNVSIDDKELSYESGKTEIIATGDAVSIKAPEIAFNGGELGGLVKLEQLKQNLDSLKQMVEAIHSALPGAFTAIGAGAAANGPGGSTAYTTAMTGKTIILTDMENTKVKH